MSIKNNILSRAIIIYFLMVIAAISIISKAAYVNVKEGDYLDSLKKNQSLIDIEIIANRGDILARDGRLLATSLPTYEIRMDTRATGLTDKIFNDSIDALCQSLSRLFNKPASRYKSEIVAARREGRRYHLVERRVDYIQMQAIKEFPIFNLGRNRGGLVIELENIRWQPHGGLAGRTIGYLTRDPNGNHPGLEGSFDAWLRGENGVGVVQRLPGGTTMPVSGAHAIEPRDGGDVVSTIDVNMQDAAETSLRQRLQYHRADHGTVVVMEVATGEIKAIANLGRDEFGNYREIYNYALGESIEPGSTFKLMTYMAMFEDGKLQITDSIDNGQSGAVYFHRKLVSDDGRRETLGWLNVEEAFAHSSNISVTKWVDHHYRGRERQFIDRLYAMNLNQRLGLEISGEADPEIKYPDNRLWSGLSLTQKAYGYELRMAPIQILTFYNAVANDGKMVKPLFVKRLTRHGAVERTFDTQVIKSSIASASTIRQARRMMEAVVEYGTARRINTDMYQIAGKTGTAQAANERYGYRDRKYYATFVGYFPADRPKYSMIVSIYDPKVNGYGGGVVAAPVFREVADKIFAADPDMRETLRPERRGVMADIPQSKSGNHDNLSFVLRELNIPVAREDGVANWVTATVNDTKIELKPREMDNSLVPNVVGMGLKDALFLLEEREMRVSVRGRGRVASQSISPGSRITPNGSITLELRVEN